MDFRSLIKRCGFIAHMSELTMDHLQKLNNLSFLTILVFSIHTVIISVMKIYRTINPQSLGKKINPKHRKLN